MKYIKYIFALVVVIAGLALWLFHTGNFPAALVDGRPILAKDVLARQHAGGAQRDVVLSQMIGEKEVAIVADKFGVSVGNSQLNSQLAQIKQETNFESLLARYELSENEFKNNVLKPELLYTNLELWFNGQRLLNPAQYALADSIKAQMGTGSASGTFASLAAKYNQDEATKGLEGNLGFVQINSLWPEFQAALESASAGQVVVAPGRDGLYIFNILAKDSGPDGGTPRAEIAEIYLKTESFDNWYNQQTQNIKTKILI